MRASDITSYASLLGLNPEAVLKRCIESSKFTALVTGEDLIRACLCEMAIKVTKLEEQLACKNLGRKS